MFTPGGGGYGSPGEHDDVTTKDDENAHAHQLGVTSSGSLGQYKMNQEST